MASSVRVLEPVIDHESDPTPITELPTQCLYLGNNRRFIPRVTGQFSAIRPNGEQFVGLDLSFGGMLCLSEEPIWPGNEFCFDLLIDNQSMAARGRVVELVTYNSQIAMRVRFLDVDSATRRAIASWMAKTTL